MCQEGRFECVSDEQGDPVITSFGYLVYQDSFWNWVKDLKGAETQEE
jgi:hypothetical protein